MWIAMMIVYSFWGDIDHRITVGQFENQQQCENFRLNSFSSNRIACYKMEYAPNEIINGKEIHEKITKN